MGSYIRVPYSKCVQGERVYQEKRKTKKITSNSKNQLFGRIAKIWSDTPLKLDNLSINFDQDY